MKWKFGVWVIKEEDEVEMKLDRERARDLSFYREREGELQLGAII